MKQQVKNTSIQLIKYGIVGVSNSLLTLFVIYICNDLLSMNLYVSNAIGYIVGLINSFVWNKNWVFKSHDRKVTTEMTLFVIGFFLCYGINILVLWILVSIGFLRDISVMGMEAPQFGNMVSTDRKSVLLGKSL